MKRIVTLVLVVVLVLSLSIAAFAEYTNGVPAIVVNGGSGPSLLLGVYNSANKKITVIPGEDIAIYTIKSASEIPWEDQEAFLKACEETGSTKDKTVRAPFYLWIREDYKELDGFAYVRYPFTCVGKNVKLTVNGKEMEVCPISENSWFAKLTEFGTIVISSD